MLSFGGEGVVNSLIDKLPIELHIPTYQYCGPGTKLNKRLRRGDPGINALDAACKEHDIAYSKHKDLSSRHEADRILEEAARSRFKAKDSSLGEKASSWAVANVMKVKRKLGMGAKKNKQMRNFNKSILSDVRNSLKGYRGGKIMAGARISLKAARRVIKKAGGRKRIKIPRMIPLPKSGGILPLLPILAGLSAMGSLAGGMAGIARAVNKVKDAQRQMDESKRHNKTMEAIALGNKNGAGLYLKPYRKGLGLYTSPHPKNR